uniref:ATP synthase F0 subunit 8 n=1 Tax=Rhodymenia pseudopalmata TaxID=31502 RepID=V9NEP7_RHOPU|nr:ATP synthase F0 subunit 8 [Rhodymenia pseudopalmata]AGO19276.1 ATP synthase F0 subunit 8 [Rhodymenia pseudopalmata]
MPQLDFTIVFSQIFWLFVIFTTFYTILTHFFLPKFLISIKSRKQIVDLNYTKVLESQKKMTDRQNLIQSNLINGLSSVRNSINSSWFSILKTNQNINLASVDERIGSVIFNTTKYCGAELLSYIFLYPKALNLK